MNNFFRLSVITALGCCLAFSACSKKADLKTDYPLLQYIPADTPYAFTVLEPMPEEIVDRFYKSYDELIDAYTNIVSTTYQGYLDKAKEQNPDLDTDSNNKWMEALSKEFEDGFSLEKMESYGFSKKSVAALYGVGLLPVYRIRLSDTNLFKQAVERIETNAQDTLPQINIDGMTVWALGADSLNDFEEKAGATINASASIDIGDIINESIDIDSEDAIENESDIIGKAQKEYGKLIIALSDQDLIITFQPHGTSDDYLKQLIGVSLPNDSLASSTTLADLMQNKGYLPQGLGFMDFRELLSRFVDEPKAEDKEILALFDFEEKRAELSDVCRSELKSMVNNVPRLLYGLTELSQGKMSTESMFEVRSDLAEEMTTLTAPVPGLGDAAGFFSMGVSFDLAAMREFGLKRIDALIDSPYECEFLHTDLEKLEKAKASLNNPAAGFAEGLRGFNFVVDDLDIDAIVKVMESSEGETPDFSNLQAFMSEKFSANAVIAVDNTKTLYNMAKMFSPEVAALNLKADGVPVLLNEMFPEPLPMDVFVTMGKETFAFTMGKDAETKPQAILNSKSNDNPPMLAYSINWEQYMKIFDALLSNPEFAAEMSEDEEMEIEDVRAILNAFGGLFETYVFTMGFREDGVVFEVDITFPED